MTLEEMRSRNRNRDTITEEYEVEPGYTLTIGGVASFSAIARRREEAEALRVALVAFPLRDRDGAEVALDDETLSKVIIVACSVKAPEGVTLKDVLELSIAYPLQFGDLFMRVAELNAGAVEIAIDAAEQRLAEDPTTPPVSESPSDTADDTPESAT